MPARATRNGTRRTFRTYDYNVAESKRLLASIGFKDGNGDGVLEDTRGNPVSFQLKTNADNTMRVATANFIRDDLAKVGIRVILTPIDFNSLITNLRSDLQYEAILLGSQSGVPPDPGERAEPPAIVRASRTTSSSGSRSPRRPKRRGSISWSTSS